jgi:hypothetical protein
MDTLDLVLSGRSIARYGDGEFKVAAGRWIKSQDADAGLAQRLCDILKDSGECLVGIPNILSETPKSKFWNAHLHYEKLLVDRSYASSFITRPDSAPWIHTPEYWAKLESLWRGRPVTLVRGSTKSLTGELLVQHGSGPVTEVVTERKNAWYDYSSLLKRIGTPERAILCLGATATVMAVDLCAQGVHAIDLGHVGMFYKKQIKGELMIVTDEDKVA